MAEFPHCNSSVLHAPGECVYCDKYPERQAVHAAGKTPFTSVESNGWRGNVAWTPQMVDDETRYWEEIREQYVRTGELPPTGWIARLVSRFRSFLR